MQTGELEALPALGLAFVITGLGTRKKQYKELQVESPPQARM